MLDFKDVIVYLAGQQAAIATQCEAAIVDLRAQVAQRDKQIQELQLLLDRYSTSLRDHQRDLDKLADIKAAPFPESITWPPVLRDGTEDDGHPT